MRTQPSHSGCHLFTPVEVSNDLWPLLTSVPSAFLTFFVVQRPRGLESGFSRAPSDNNYQVTLHLHTTCAYTASTRAHRLAHGSYVFSSPTYSPPASSPSPPDQAPCIFFSSLSNCHLPKAPLPGFSLLTEQKGKDHGNGQESHVSLFKKLLLFLSNCLGLRLDLRVGGRAVLRDRIGQ